MLRAHGLAVARGTVGTGDPAAAIDDVARRLL
jgi:hypothetical protein